MLLVENLLMSGGGLVDPYFENVALLLHGDGTNGGQNNTFIDSSSNNFTITRNGNTTQGSFNPYGTLWSNHFDGSGDYLTAPANAAFQFGTGDFTVETWIYPTASGSNNQYFITMRAANGGASGTWGLGQESNKFVFDEVVVGATTSIEGTSVPVLNAWTHVAVTRSGTAIRLFVNGALETSATSNTNFSASVYPLYIGWATDPGGLYTRGYLSNIRIVKGTAVYTAAFTPPTSPLTAISNTSFLTCQSNRFIDNSTNNLAITRNGDTRVTSFAPFAPPTVYTSAVGGSAYIDGSGDTLVTPATAAFAYGTGDFTYETWVYPESTPNDSYIISQPSAGAGFPLLTIYNGALHWVPSAGSYQAFALSVTNGQWNHIAAVRQSGTVYGFLNGVRGSTSHAYTTSLGSDRFIRLCEGNRYKGYLSDTRISNVAVYTTTTYTIPTSKVAATSSTNLLLNYTNAAIFDSAAKNDLETVGNAQIDTTTKKFGTGSIKFDGTGDYLTLPSIPAYNFSGTFTIEFWINFTVINNTINTMISGTAQNTQLFITTKNNGTGIRMGLSGVGEYAAGSKTWNTGTWYHVALVRNVSSIKFYVDGIDVTDSTYTDTTAYSGDIHMGIAGAAYPLNGFIDEFRITNGVARYTANFTPPTRPFPDK